MKTFRVFVITANGRTHLYTADTKAKAQMFIDMMKENGSNDEYGIVEA